MISVSQAISDILQSDEVALEAMRAGLLNLSAYAKTIQKTVEKTTFKDVQKGTIVVALSRLAKNVKSLATPLKPEVLVTDLSIKSSLGALTYEKTADIQRKIAVLSPFQLTTSDIFTITEGPTEITLIIAEKAKDKVIKEFKTKAKSQVDDLVAVTVQYKEELANTANLHFALLSGLAAKRIHIIEIVSTFTETTFVVKREDMEKTINVLNIYFHKK
ncbi:MAG TPA: hypothetical protein VLF68_00040 [Candidatus Saccharimonadales bacterium]|nr:hypothetical protein [Candidatus Saccharimonadales bacterium]